METFTLHAQDQQKLPCYLWPANHAKAVMLIIHGLAEHASRYGRFADSLNQADYSVVSMDLRGHGNASRDSLGYFSKRGGWQQVIADIGLLHDHIREQYPGLPIVLCGHSMGSIFARAIIQRTGSDYACCILSGVTLNKPGLRDIAPFMTKFISIFGANRPSKFLDKLSFGSFNKAFEPGRTDFDWLSRDEKEVDKYVEDGLCGFVSTPSLFHDLSVMLLDTLKKRNIEAIPQDLPILILSGAEDPCGSFGEDAKLLHDAYQSVGCDVRYKLYEGARHEILNETNRDEVIGDIIAYLKENL